MKLGLDLVLNVGVESSISQQGLVEMFGALTLAGRMSSNQAKGIQ